MVDTAGLPDRFMALAGALSGLAKALDRKVLGPTGTSVILFILVIAESGAGKQHIINCIRMILRAMGAEEALVATGIASVQSIEETLQGRPPNKPPNPSVLVPIDEYGSFLSRISSKNQTGNVSEIPATLQTLWGWQPQLEWTGSMKVGKDNVTVYGPAFSILASSTERAFFTALKRKDIASGFVNRHLLLNAGRGAPERVKPKYSWTQCPGWLIEALKEVAGEPAEFDNRPLSIAGKHGGHVMLRDFRQIEWGPGAEDRWYEFEKEIRSMPSLEDRELYIRAPEIAERIATVVAVFRGSKVVDLQDLEWAIELARHSTRQLAHGLKEHMLEAYEEADLVKRIREEFERKVQRGQAQHESRGRSARRSNPRPNPQSLRAPHRRPSQNQPRNLPPPNLRRHRSNATTPPCWSPNYVLEMDRVISSEGRAMQNFPRKYNIGAAYTPENRQKLCSCHAKRSGKSKLVTRETAKTHTQTPTLPPLLYYFIYIKIIKNRELGVLRRGWKRQIISGNFCSQVKHGTEALNYFLLQNSPKLFLGYQG
jgi:hypothetical protein